MRVFMAGASWWWQDTAHVHDSEFRTVETVSPSQQSVSAGGPDTVEHKVPRFVLVGARGHSEFLLSLQVDRDEPTSDVDTGASEKRDLLMNLRQLLREDGADACDVSVSSVACVAFDGLPELALAPL